MQVRIRRWQSQLLPLSLIMIPKSSVERQASAPLLQELVVRLKKKERKKVGKSNLNFLWFSEKTTRDMEHNPLILPLMVSITSVQ